MRLSNPRLPVLASLALSSSVLNLPKPFQTIPLSGTVWVLHLSPTHESKLSTLSQNEEPPTLCVEGLWSRQESNLDLVFRKHLFYPLNYGTIEPLGSES